MDFYDVYYAFAQTKAERYEGGMEKKEEEFVEMRNYDFGTIVENEKLACYKI